MKHCTWIYDIFRAILWVTHDMLFYIKSKPSKNVFIRASDTKEKNDHNYCNPILKIQWLQLKARSDPKKFMDVIF